MQISRKEPLGGSGNADDEPSDDDKENDISLE